MELMNDQEYLLEGIYSKMSNISLYEGTIKTDIDKVISNIKSDPSSIKEFNKLIQRFKSDKIKLSVINSIKILKIATEIVTNPEISIVDSKSLQYCISLPVIIVSEFIEENGLSKKMYKRLISDELSKVNKIKNKEKDTQTLNIMNAYITSLEKAIDVISSTKSVKEGVTELGLNGYNTPTESTIEDNFDDTIAGTYLERLFNFECDVVSIISKEEIQLEAFMYLVKESIILEKMELSLEGKTTDKVSRKLVNKTKEVVRKAEGKNKNGSKLKDNIKRIDKTISDAINRKIDQVINTGRDDKREKLITGKTSIKLGNLLSTAIKSIIGFTASKAVLGPVGGTVVTIIGLLAKYALSKNTEVREKKRILQEFETELKIVKEKIEDSKGENDKKQKYELMRIENNLNKEITRIKYNLRHY